MAAPNIVNVATINGESQGFELSTTLDASLMLVASNKLVKINRMQVANIDGSAAVDVTIQVTKATRTSAATGGSIAGATFKLANTVSVPADAVLVLSDTPIYLEEGDTLKGGASAASDATLFISYDVLDD
jgi:hypothetical protein|tara:strand:+ start:1347 stop:1736 length:390 start_codon:yes stop_codon:yes gene_type:complete